MHRGRQIPRRKFLQQTAAVLAAPYVIPAAALGADGQVAPSNRVAIGMIGMGRQAIAYNLREFLREPDAQIVAICDVDRWRLEVTDERIASCYGAKMRSGKFGGVARYADFRELLARKDIDAVMISTPDHWHVPMSVAAVKAGKDVACEKPLTRSIAEGRFLSDLVAKHHRVFRTDSEFRSIPVFHRACQLVRNGRIGQLKTIRTGVPLGRFTSPPFVSMPVPEELNYDLWLGPAPNTAYTEQRVHQQKGYERPGWMNIRDYCDGMVLNWGAHLNDIAQWGNDTDRSGPVEVEGHGVYPPKESMWNVLMEFEITYRYANGVQLIYKTDSPYIRFEGTEGWIQAFFGKGGIQAEPKSILDSPISPQDIHLPLKPQKRDFLDAVKTRGQTLEDAEVGHRTASVCHLGHIAVQLGQKLKWDPKAERFVDNDAANKLLSGPPARSPWSLKELAT